MSNAMSEQSYFASYEDAEIHRLMINDKPRTEAYREAIFKNRHLFRGKVAMDLGAGTGILSLFMAQAGAKKVYAVEASDIAPIIVNIAEDNGYKDVIEVFHARVEDIYLPDDVKVDVLVSEWMGFYLLHESMINSVIYARNNFLDEEGVMFPSEAKIYAAPCSLDALCVESFGFWDDVYGFNLKAMKQYSINKKRSKPEVYKVPASNLLSEPLLVNKFCLSSVLLEDVKSFQSTHFVGINREGNYDGLCLWFDCVFNGVQYSLEQDKEIGCEVVLSTSPLSPETHWKQTVIVFGTGRKSLLYHPTRRKECTVDSEKKANVDEKTVKNAPLEGIRPDKNVCMDSKDIGDEDSGKDTIKEGKINNSSEQGCSSVNCAESSQRSSDLERLENAKRLKPDIEEVVSSDDDSGRTSEKNDNDSIDSKNFNDSGEVDENFLEEEEVIGFSLQFYQAEDNPRHYSITMENVDPEETEHPIPCVCPMPRCRIIAKMIENDDAEFGD